MYKIPCDAPTGFSPTRTTAKVVTDAMGRTIVLSYYKQDHRI